MSSLRELVAVEVMKWEKAESFPRMSRSDGRTLFFDGREYKIEDDCGQVSRPFRPDTNIADAWRVVEKMMHNYMVLYPHEHEDGAYVTAKTNNWDDVRAREDTMPLAICIAALRAVGVSDDRIEKARSKQ